MDSLLVVGEGPVAAALQPMAEMLGWECRVVSSLEDVHAALPSTSAVVVTSHDAEVDAAALHAALDTEGVVYIGGMGSRKTRERRGAWLADHGVDEQAQSPIHAPAGLDIGADGPPEIALAILAELVATVRGREGVGSLKDRPGPIHPELAPGTAYCPPG